MYETIKSDAKVININYSYESLFQLSAWGICQGKVSRLRLGYLGRRLIKNDEVHYDETLQPAG